MAKKAMIVPIFAFIKVITMLTLFRLTCIGVAMVILVSYDNY